MVTNYHSVNTILFLFCFYPQFPHFLDHVDPWLVHFSAKPFPNPVLATGLTHQKNQICRTELGTQLELGASKEIWLNGVWNPACLQGLKLWLWGDPGKAFVRFHNGSVWNKQKYFRLDKL